MPSKIEMIIDSLDILVPIAETVPVVGTTIKGSLEATKKILEYAQVRQSLTAPRDGCQNYVCFQ
jgi:hypothetical protein